MTFRTRLTISAAVAVAISIALASLTAYIIVRNDLQDQIDSSLRNRVFDLRNFGEHFEGQPPGSVPADGTGFGDQPYVQIVSSSGRVLLTPGQTQQLPVTEEARHAAGSSDTDVDYGDMTVNGTHVRVLTAPLGNGFAVQAARPLGEFDSTLSSLRLALFLIAGTGIALAAALGALVANHALRPVRQLTDAAEHVTETRDLSSRIEVESDDELGRLAGSFNTMLAALDDSVARQRQLVADASHELRTPLTSLRTNIEVLASGAGLEPDAREQLLGDVKEQLEEMTVLVGDVVDLARGEESDRDMEDVRLDLLTAAAVERARRHAPATTFTTDLEETVVRGVAQRLDRAIANLLDNGAKWNGTGGSVDVTVRDGAVTVRDHGPGVAEADLPHVFDRFYRAQDARGMPGSGLGLAIVRQVAESHGGTATAGNAPDGGAVFTLGFPEPPAEA